MTLPQEPSSPHHKRFFSFRVVAIVLCLLFIVAILTPVLGMIALLAPGPQAENKTVIVAHGANASEIGALLTREDIIYFPLLFRAAVKFMASDTLKAGEYAIPARASALDIVVMMQEGRSVVRLFTVAEGLTSAEVIHSLTSDTALTGLINAVPAEGSLLPETYRYSFGDNRTEMIVRMQKAMQEKLTEVWNLRDKDLPLKSPQEAVILASIVEKETGKPEERPRIAGVFYNRLAQNMKLQSDPTVIYAMTGGKQILDRALTHDDLSFSSPLNTYMNNGLPPTPICNPGRASLVAATHPEHNNYLYFVADGTGGHAFAADLATQNENINRWHQAISNLPAH